MDAGLIGAILGTCLGIAGGAFGTYMSIKQTNGPLERAFMVRACAATWLAVVLFLALTLLLPTPYNHLLWIPYAVLLPLGIFRMNGRLAQLRQADLR